MGAAAVLPTMGDALADAAARLAAAGVPEPRADAEVLLAHVLGTSRAALLAGIARPLPPEVENTFATLVARRSRREPVQHLVGEWEFWSLPLVVDRRVLVPRPETELLVETALRVAPAAGHILDVGTGSGAIAAALACERPAAAVWASDVDADALAVARVNLARHAPRVGLVRGDGLAPFRPAAFDLVVANPPYVADADLPNLAPEVRDHEPRVALAAGSEGLDALLALVTAAPRVLLPGGWLVLEMGLGQAPRVRDAVERDGRYAGSSTTLDPAGIERVLAAQRG
jgi:release factor glutamine methyltransferase